MRIVSLLFIFLVFTLFFCTSKKSEWRNALTKIDRDSLFRNNYNDWELISMEDYPNSAVYHLYKMDGDTIKRLAFYYADKSLLRVQTYEKIYPISNGDTCHLKMMSSVDTLYFYRQHNGVKNFIVGEYGYKFNRGHLTSSELSYYLDHEDSLRKIRGSNLPMLPGRK